MRVGADQGVAEYVQEFECARFLSEWMGETEVGKLDKNEKDASVRS